VSVTFHKMVEKVFFFDIEGDTRKVEHEVEIESLEDITQMVKETYTDVEIPSGDVKLWTKDQTYQIRHKVESPEQIYNGAVLEVTFGSNQKRKLQDKKKEVVSKKARITGPRFVLRLRGIPFKATQKQIREFFDGIKLTRVQILTKPDGRPSGDGLVEFENEQDMKEAMLKDKENMGERYIDVIKTTGEEMDRALGIFDPEKIMNLKNKVLRMKGLPWSATEEDVLNFFKEGNVQPAKVHIISDVATGRATGNAYAEFESKAEITDALKLNRKVIGERYIELYEAYMRDLKAALGLPSDEIGSTGNLFDKGEGGHGDACIRMRGLPWNTTDLDIVEFFKEVDISPVRIHLKQDGSEAIVEFRSADVSKAMSRHKSYIRNRYVELYRVSWGEVSSITGIPGGVPPYRLY